jgi:hypothetical protein
MLGTEDQSADAGTLQTTSQASGPTRTWNSWQLLVDLSRL